MSQNKLETTNAEIQTLDADQIDAVSGGALPHLLIGAAILGTVLLIALVAK